MLYLRHQIFDMCLTQVFYKAMDFDTDNYGYEVRRIFYPLEEGGTMSDIHDHISEEVQNGTK